MEHTNDVTSPFAAVAELQSRMASADRILVGAGAGLSAAAGLSYFDHDVFRTYRHRRCGRSVRRRI